MVSIPAHGWTVSLCCALLLGKGEVVLYSLGCFYWAACGSRRSQRVTKLFLRFGISFCLSKKLISFCVWLKFSEFWVQWDFFFFLFCKPLFFTFSLYNFYLLPSNSLLSCLITLTSGFGSIWQALFSTCASNVPERAILPTVPACPR